MAIKVPKRVLDAREKNSTANRKEDEQPQAAPSVPVIDEETARLWGLKNDSSFTGIPTPTASPVQPQAPAAPVIPALNAVEKAKSLIAPKVNTPAKESLLAKLGQNKAGKSDATETAAPKAEAKPATLDDYKTARDNAQNRLNAAQIDWAMDGGLDYGPSFDAYNAAYDEFKSADKAWNDFRSENRLMREESDALSAELSELLKKDSTGKLSAKEAARAIEIQNKLSNDSDTAVGRIVDTLGGTIMGIGAAGAGFARSIWENIKPMALTEKELEGTGVDAIEARYDELGQQLADMETRLLQGQGTAEEWEQYYALDKERNDLLAQSKAIRSQTADVQGSGIGQLASYLQNKADYLIGSAMQNATFGERTLANIVKSGVEMFTDIKRGGNSLFNMFKRVVGNTYNESLAAGESREVATKKSLRSAIIEVGSEKAFTGFGAYGKGVADGGIRNFLHSLENSSYYGAIVKIVMAGGEESAEELIAAALEPWAESVTDPDAWRKLYGKANEENGDDPKEFKARRDAFWNDAGEAMLCAFILSAVGEGYNITASDFSAIAASVGMTEEELASKVQSFGDEYNGTATEEQTETKGSPKDKMMHTMPEAVAEALEGVEPTESGYISNSKARELLKNPKVVAAIEADVGHPISGTESERKSFVKRYVAGEITENKTAAEEKSEADVVEDIVSEAAGEEAEQNDASEAETAEEPTENPEPQETAEEQVVEDIVNEAAGTEAEEEATPAEEAPTEETAEESPKEESAEEAETEAPAAEAEETAAAEEASAEQEETEAKEAAEEQPAEAEAAAENSENPAPTEERELSKDERRVVDLLQNIHRKTNAEVEAALDSIKFNRAFKNLFGTELNGKQSLFAAAEDFAANGIPTQSAVEAMTEAQTYEQEQAAEQAKADAMQHDTDIRRETAKAAQRQEAKDIAEVQKQNDGLIKSQQAELTRVLKRLSSMQTKDIRSKIGKAINEINKAIKNPTAGNHVEQGMRDAVAEFMNIFNESNLAEAQQQAEDIRQKMSDIVTNYEMKSTELQEKINNATDPAIAQKYSDTLAKLTQSTKESLEASQKRIKQLTSKALLNFDNLQNLYENLTDPGKDNITANSALRQTAVSEYTQQVKDYIDEVKKNLGDAKTIYDLDDEQLLGVLNSIKGVHKAIKDADRVIVNEQEHEKMRAVTQGRDTVAKLASEIKGAIGKLTRNVSKGLGSSFMRGRTVFEELAGYDKSNIFWQMYEGLHKGWVSKLTAMQKARSFFNEVMSDPKMSEWREETHSYKSLGFELSNGQACSLAMLLDQEDSANRILRSGLESADPKLAYKNNLWTILQSHGWGNVSNRFGGLQAEMQETAKRITAENEKAGIDEEQTKKEIDEAIAEMVDKKRNEILDELLVKLGDQGKKVTDSARAMFDWYQEQIGLTQEELYGFSSELVDKYFPMAIAKNFMNAKQISNAMAAETDPTQLGYLKSRTGGYQPLALFDIFDVCNNYSERMSTFLGMAVPVKNTRDVLSAVDNRGQAATLKDDIARKLDQHTADFIDNWLNDIAGRSNNTNNGRWDEIIGMFANNAVSAIFYGNAVVAGTQAASLITAYSDINISSLAAGAAKAATQTKAQKEATIKLIAKYTPRLDERIGGLRIGWDTSTAATRAQNKGSFGANFVSNVDMNTIIALWHAAYNQTLSNMSTEGETVDTESDDFYHEVAKLFGAALESTQPMYSNFEKTDAARHGGAVSKALTLYSTVRMQNWNQIVSGVGELSAARRHYAEAVESGEGVEEARRAKQDASHKAARKITGVVLSNALYAIMKSALKVGFHKDDKYRDEDGDLTWDSFLKGFGWTLAEAEFGTVPVIGAPLVAAIENMVNGSNWYSMNTDNFSIPVIDALNSVTSKLGALAAAVANGDRKKAGKTWRTAYSALTTLFSMGTGYGVSNIEDILNATVNLGLEIYRKTTSDSETSDISWAADFSVGEAVGMIGDAAAGNEIDIIEDMFRHRSNTDKAQLIVDNFLAGKEWDSVMDELADYESETVGADTAETMVRTRVQKAYTDSDPKSRMSREDAMKILTEVCDYDRATAEDYLRKWDFKNEFGTTYNESTLKEMYIKGGRLGNGTELTRQNLVSYLEEYGGLSNKDAEAKASYYNFLKRFKDDPILSNASQSDVNKISEGMDINSLRRYITAKETVNKLEVNTSRDKQRNYSEIDSFIANTYNVLPDIVKAELGKNNSMLEHLAEARFAGLKSEAVYKWYERYRDIDEAEGLGAQQRALQFRDELSKAMDRGEIDSKQKTFLQNEFKYWVRNAVNTDTYDKLYAAGVKSEVAIAYGAEMKRYDGSKMANKAAAILATVPEEMQETVWNLVKPKGTNKTWAQVKGTAGQAKLKPLEEDDTIDEDTPEDILVNTVGTKAYYDAQVKAILSNFW